MIELLKAIFFVPRCIRYIWRAERGSWFIFRDAPEDIVDYFANEFQAPDDRFEVYVRQAQDEMRLRAWRREAQERGRA